MGWTNITGEFKTYDFSNNGAGLVLLGATRVAFSVAATALAVTALYF